MSERSGRREQSEQYGASKASEWYERMSEQTSKWPSTYVLILVCSRPQRSGGGIALPRHSRAQRYCRRRDKQSIDIPTPPCPAVGHDAAAAVTLSVTSSLSAFSGAAANVFPRRTPFPQQPRLLPLSHRRLLFVPRSGPIRNRPARKHLHPYLPLLH